MQLLNERNTYYYCCNLQTFEQSDKIIHKAARSSILTFANLFLSFGAYSDANFIVILPVNVIVMVDNSYDKTKIFLKRQK